MAHDPRTAERDNASGAKRGHVARPLAPLAFLALVVGTIVIMLGLSSSTVLGFSSGRRGSGVGAVQTRAVPSFAYVDLAGSSRVRVHVGSPRSVIVHADDNLIDSITTDVRRGQLVIGESAHLASTRSLVVDVTVPRLSGATLSGSGPMDVTGARAKRFTARLSGSGVLHVAGSVATLDASLSGSGSMQLGDLAALAVRATVSGSGRLLVDAASSLIATIPGSGAVVYTGHPSDVRLDVRGSGAVLAR